MSGRSPSAKHRGVKRFAGGATPLHVKRFDADGNEIVVGRNDPCPCGSGRKLKRCCMLRAVMA